MATTDAPLAVAYAATCYRLWWDRISIDLMIGRVCPPLPGGAAAWTMLTAANPGSVALSSAENRQRQAALEDELRAGPARWTRGENIDPAGVWPVERSVWIQGGSRAAHCARAEKYGQLAIVVATPGQLVELIWTETGRRAIESAP
jgi:hypothetical protein